MKRYVYVNVEYKMKDMVLATISQHREIIDEYAKKGYKYCGSIATEISITGCAKNIDLIFEKDK